MVPNKSLDDSYTIIATLLCDVNERCLGVFNTSSLRLTLKKVKKRLDSEGISFLTKTLPRLGKALDRALCENAPLNSTDVAFEAMPGSKLPRFLGELFSRVFQQDGTLLESPCNTSVGVLRDILYLFYKYELPYTDDQEQEVVSRFEKTESDLSTVVEEIQGLETLLQTCSASSLKHHKDAKKISIVRNAKDLLAELFLQFNPYNIHPRHGPGAVATKQRLWEKYQWTNVSDDITKHYPFDAYFCASNGHVCDTYDKFHTITNKKLPARVILVPKDSRGPRLISCEPVDYQWVQQGLGRAIVDLVERHPLTRGNVRFTDQSPNRIGALFGSQCGRYATLDLKEASDRVTTALVRLLFPEHVFTCLEACRTSSTTLPDGRVLELHKFAPMGSALCFPVLALTVWAILTAGCKYDADTRESIYVYGDDVIVPTTYVDDAIEQLESFGLLVNRDKSCTSGFFRESCGMDAFKGVNVTPVRLRTVWSSTPSPDVYTSWIAYANSFYDKRYYLTYHLIVGSLHRVYGELPSEDMALPCPSLRSVPDAWLPKRRRVNRSLQKIEYRVTTTQAPVIRRTIDGWSALLRYFAEASDQTPFGPTDETTRDRSPSFEGIEPFSVGSYTRRKTSVLVKRWL